MATPAIDAPGALHSAMTCCLKARVWRRRRLAVGADSVRDVSVSMVGAHLI
jgi:hypothetical protein